MCEIFGQDIITVRSYQFSFKKLQNADFNVEDEPKFGRLSVIDKKRLRRKVKEIPDITIRELGIIHGTIINKLHQLGFVSKSNK